MSYGNAETSISLQRTGATLIEGRNLDDTVQGVGANGVGKFQSIHSPIKTVDGWVKMGDLRLGQMLQMPDGSSAPITGIFPQGKQQLYRVKFADGRSTLAGGPHLWTVFSHRWGKSGTRGSKTVTTEDIIKLLAESEQRNNKPWYNIFVPTVTHPSIVDTELPIDPYLLGVMLGDGSMSGNRALITSADESIIEECSVPLLRDHNQGLRQYNPDTNNGYDWSVVNISSIKHKHNPNSLKNKLNELGLWGSKSDTKFIPSIYLEQTSETQKLDIIAGLLDTDGTVGKTKNVSYTTVSLQLAEDLQYLIRSLGGKATLTTKRAYYRDSNGNKVEGNLSYNLSIRYHNPKDLFRLDRKRDRLSDGVTQYANEGLCIVSVEEAHVEECQCIMVDHPDHLYITDDYIVTHNTTIINAIIYACYGKALSNVTLDKLVNIVNGKNCVVGITFKKGKDLYEITRYRKVKSGADGTFITIFKNGDYDKDLAKGTLPESNKYIEEEIIGMSFDLFKQIVIFDADSTSFFKEKAATQREMVEDLFQLSILSEKAALLKDANKDVTSEIKIQENSIQHLERAVEDHEDQLARAKSRLTKWERAHNADLSDLETTLEELESIDIEAERKLFEEIDDLTAQIQKLREKESELRLQLSDAEKELDSTESAMAVHRRSIKSFNRDVIRIEKDLTRILSEIEVINSNTCPTCKQPLPDSGELLEAANINKDKYETELTSINEESAEAASQLKDLEKKVLPPKQKTYEKIEVQMADVLEEIKTLRKRVPTTEYDSIEELMKVEQQVTSVKEKIVHKSSEENPHFEALQEVEDKVIEKPNYDEINKLKKLLDHQKLLLKLLTDKKSFIRKTLINKRLPALNDRLKHYVASFGLPFRVEFQSDLAAKVMRFGKAMDYGNLSGGQRARLNLAVALSFRDTLEHIHFPVDLCVFDEVLDRGLDDVGVMTIINHLMQRARDVGCMFIITHKNDVASRFEQRLLITMKNGFSFIDNENPDNISD